MALFAPKSVKNVATTTADKAKTTGGINDLYPYLSAFSLAFAPFLFVRFAV